MTEILFCDKDIIVCIKPVGTESESLAAELSRECCDGEKVFTVHRLDKPVGGIMVFAKNGEAAERLSRAISEGRFCKRYLAVAGGRGSAKPEGETLCDLLYHDPRTNKTFVVKKKRKGVKEAVLNYKLCGSREYKEEIVHLLDIELVTGRSHQVRVQFGSRKLPLWGDGKYGSNINGNIALFSYRLEFSHPVTDLTLSFSVLPAKELPWNLFDVEIGELC